jgi:transcription factor SPN1
MDAIVKSTSSRRRKKDGIDLEQMADQEIEDMRRRMAQAAEADNEGRKRGEPARHKLKLLPEVVALLNKSNLKESIVDPESNILEAVRFFLEPLSDGSLPAYDIQKELFASLAKLPINKDTLVASGIGKVIMFYIKSKRPELIIKRQAERLFTDWTRPILRRTDDYRKKEFAQADYDPAYVPFRTPYLLVIVVSNISTDVSLRLPTLLPIARQLPKPPSARRPSRYHVLSSARAWRLAA